MTLRMYIYWNLYFHDVDVAQTTNLDSSNHLSQADFDRVALLVQEQYRKAHPDCSADEHFAKSTEVNFNGKKLWVYLRRDNDPFPVSFKPRKDLFGLRF